MAPNNHLHSLNFFSYAYIVIIVFIKQFCYLIVIFAIVLHSLLGIKCLQSILANDHIIIYVNIPLYFWALNCLPFFLSSFLFSLPPSFPHFLPPHLSRILNNALQLWLSLIFLLKNYQSGCQIAVSISFYQSVSHLTMPPVI